MAPDVGAKLIPGTVPGINLAPTSGVISDPISEDGFFQKTRGAWDEKNNDWIEYNQGVCMCTYTHRANLASRSHSRAFAPYELTGMMIIIFKNRLNS